MANGTYTKWDPKNLEIRTLAVERALEPLVIQVTQLGKDFKKNITLPTNYPIYMYHVICTLF